MHPANTNHHFAWILFSLSYAVIAFGCASCPKITCGREGCGTEFCYHCKQLWHPNQTCDTARQQRAQTFRLRSFRSSSLSYSQESGAAGNINTSRTSVLSAHPSPFFKPHTRAQINLHYTIHNINIHQKYCMQNDSLAQSTSTRWRHQAMPSLCCLHHQDEWWKL